MNPNTPTPEPSPQIPEAVPAATRLVISPIDEAAVLKVLSEAPEPVRAQPVVTPEPVPTPQATPSETPINSSSTPNDQAQQAPFHDYAPAAHAANPTEPSSIRTEPETPNVKVPIKWPSVIMVGALMPLALTILNKLLAFVLILTLMPLFYAAAALGPLSSVIWVIVALIPLAIIYKIFVPILRNKLFLQHPVLIFFGIFSFTLILQPIITIVTYIALAQGPATYNSGLAIGMEVLQWALPIVAGIIGVVLATLITNVFNQEHPRRRVAIMWTIILLPVAAVAALYVVSYWNIYSLSM